VTGHSARRNIIPIQNILQELTFIKSKATTPAITMVSASGTIARTIKDGEQLVGGHRNAAVLLIGQFGMIENLSLFEPPVPVASA